MGRKLVIALVVFVVLICLISGLVLGIYLSQKKLMKSCTDEQAIPCLWDCEKGGWQYYPGMNTALDTRENCQAFCTMDYVACVSGQSRDSLTVSDAAQYQTEVALLMRDYNDYFLKRICLNAIMPCVVLCPAEPDSERRNCGLECVRKYVGCYENTDERTISDDHALTYMAEVNEMARQMAKETNSSG
jgi:hypothetical protein